MTSSISGCTECQVGGPQALRAFDQAFVLHREELEAQRAQLETAQRESTRFENQPIAGATVGSIINVSV
ncbi:MAG TPA: hypothetical protein PKL28_12345 [Rhodocyclaceae bacterium]|nr:hypothetical protein [Rhodocyclaceae bacterium]HNM22082.1 hypothetical protein [Rhodocyclaceae bacterium]HNM81839.1 hypothetical protein [Rhodocyclaceae bacterium]HNP05171.1 hypothetical protein [Rhodocyclaceae bacterium]